jgi:hypothetical protein
VKVIGVFAGLPAIGREVEYPFFLIDADDVFAVKGPAGDLVLQLAGAVIEIEMGPAVLLAPFDQFLAAVDEAEAADFDVGVETFFYQGSGGGIADINLAYVDAVQVAAGERVVR